MRQFNWKELELESGQRSAFSYFLMARYILSNQDGMLDTGVTSDLEGRVQAHGQKHFRGHTQKYGINRLIYYEEFENAYETIEREK